MMEGQGKSSIAPLFQSGAITMQFQMSYSSACWLFTLKCANVPLVTSQQSSNDPVCTCIQNCRPGPVLKASLAS